MMSHDAKVLERRAIEADCAAYEQSIRMSEEGLTDG